MQMYHFYKLSICTDIALQTLYIDKCEGKTRGCGAPLQNISHCSPNKKWPSSDSHL